MNCSSSSLAPAADTALRVFLVEDAPLIQQRLHALLAPIGGVEIVGMAATPQAAIDGIANSRADLAVIDLALLDGSGLTVLEQLRDQSRPLIKIVLTNFAVPAFEARCLAAGANFFFDKTRDFLRVRDTIRRFSEQHVTRPLTDARAPLISIHLP